MYPSLHYDPNGRLHFDGQDIALLAESFGTPLYVYSSNLILSSFSSLQESLNGISHIICYSVKANSNLSLLELMGKQGGGADIVSGGELYRARRAGIPAHRIVFSGTGKSEEELEMALRENILLFSVESEQELLLLSRLAKRMGLVAQVSLRVNPALEAETHPYISTGRENDKFGIPHKEILPLYERARDWEGIHICGLSCHIGSQIMDLSIFGSGAKILRELADLLIAKGFSLKYLDMGGGLGITYGEEKAPIFRDYVKVLLEEFSPILKKASAVLILEPGRSIVGLAGILITKVLFTKNNAYKNFYIVDAAMNDFFRPVLYQASHPVWPHLRSRSLDSNADLVGPICETGDFFLRDSPLPAFEVGDYAVIGGVGAYGFVMSSNYNSRLRSAEVLIEGDYPKLVRRRESYKDLLRLEIQS